MGGIPWQAWLIVGGIAVLACLSALHALASSVRMEMHVHDTRIKAIKLRQAYAAQLAELEAQKNRNRAVEVVGQGPRQAA